MKTIPERLREYLVPVSGDRKQFREALDRNRTASEQLCRTAEVARFRETAKLVSESKRAMLAPAKA